VIAGGIQVQGGPFSLQRYRGRRFHPDRSFGDRSGKASIQVKDTTTPLGLAMQGDRKLIAVYTDPLPSGDQRLTLIRLHARQDVSGPRLTIPGLPRDCLPDGTPVLIRIRDESRTTTRIRIDGRPRQATRRKRLDLRLHPERLAAGEHRLDVRARDAAGNFGGRGVRFRVCGA